MRHESGFSLIELMIALSVVVIAIAAGVQFARGVAGWQRLRSGADLFVSAAERARALAVSRNGSFEIRVHENRKAFAVIAVGSLEPPLWRGLPRGVEFASLPRRPITFFSRGTAAPAGTFGLASESGRIDVIVAGSGRIRWEKTE